MCKFIYLFLPDLCLLCLIIDLEIPFIKQKSDTILILKFNYY